MADGRDREAEAGRLAAAVTAFAQHPDAVVHVVARDSEAWQRYATWAGEQFAETDTTFELLNHVAPGNKDRSPVLQARQAAKQAFEGSAEHVVVATLGESRMFAVAAFERSGNELKIVGAGSTHPSFGVEVPAPAATFHGREGLAYMLTMRPQLGGRRTDGIPTPEELDAAVWYAVNSIAARDERAVIDSVASNTWRDPGSAVGGREVTWTAPEVKALANTASSQVPASTAFQSLRTWTDDLAENRLWARAARRQLDNGVTVSVLSDELEGAAPDDGEEARGARWMFVLDTNGVTRSTATLQRASDGRVVLQGVVEGTPGANTLLTLMGYREAARLGVGLEHRSAGEPEHQTVTTYSGPRIQTIMHNLRTVVGDRLADLPSSGWEDAGTAGAGVDDVAEAVGRFRDSGGDVLRLTPDDPRFETLRSRVGDLVELERLSGEVDPQLTGMWQALNPEPSIDVLTGKPLEGQYPHGTTVAVAISPDGEPLAAVGYRSSGPRIELGAAGSQAGIGSDAVTAVIVDGPFRSSDGHPVGGFAATEIAELYQQAGARVGGASALDAEWLTNVELSGATAEELVDTADALNTGLRPVDLDNLAAGLRGFQDSGAQLAVLSHADPDDRARLAYVFQAVGSPLENGVTGGPPALGEEEDDPHRATIAVVKDGKIEDWATLDARPGQPIEMVDGTKTHDLANLTAIQWWVANHQARLGRDMCVSEPLFAATDPWGGGDVRDADTSVKEAKFMVDGVHRRVGDGLDAIAEGAGAEPSVSFNSKAIRVPTQPQRPDQSRGPHRPDRKRPDRGTGR
ncbi:hypothetical protein [Kribbella sp. NPDC055071]